MPAPQAPDRIEPFERQPNLFQIYQEHIAWGRILGITTVGQLNEAIVSKNIDDVILTAEALHEKKLAEIASRIATRKPAVRLILAAGPSSAGKTTFAKRLASHLRVNGLRPVVLSTDNYFVGDPVAYKYDGPKHSYKGPHPIHVEAVVGGDPDVEYCYIEGPHFH